MRRFLALVRKEWRDARALTLGAAVAVVVLTVAANELWLGYRAAAVTAAFVVPGLLALYLCAIASDLVASDVSTRRVETYALLPAGPLLLALAKLGFLLAAGLGFLAWIGVVQIGVHALAAGLDAGLGILAHADLAAAHLGVVLGLASTVFFFSTLLDRGISAVLAGVLTFGTGVYAFGVTDWGAMAIRVRAWHLGAAGGIVFLAFSGASVFAFSTGRIHLRSRRRRTVLGLAAALLFLLVPAAVGSQVLAARDRLEPGDPEAEIAWIDVSPDGRHVALGARDRAGERRAVWYVRLADDRLRTRPSAGELDGWACSFPEPWRECAVRHECGFTAWLAATDRTAEGEVDAPTLPADLSAAELPDGRLVVLRASSAVDLLDAAGRPLRRLYPPE